MIRFAEGYGPEDVAGEVAVYFRLPKHQRDWAIRVGKKVVATADTLTLTDVRFVVNERMWKAGYEGTGKRGRKRNVVAWAVGRIAPEATPLAEGDRRQVTFRFFERGDGSTPFDMVGVFFDPQTGETPDGAPVAHFDPDGRMWTPKP
ncbi:hypothetical protein [Mycolicibacterium phlei]|uniref:hypothetical protein n=1 Tax=Mycolicibacterium phlei TaxID=1771 RepID=UPI00058F4FD2|nr:hypothetical protein [Mycolicibacterium phlei]